MQATLELDSKRFRPAPELLAHHVIYINELYKRLLLFVKWSELGELVGRICRAVDGVSRVQDVVRTTDDKLWRWGPCYINDNVVAFILLPEPQSNESVTVYIEDGVDDKTAVAILREPLTMFAEGFGKELWRYDHKIKRSP